MPQKIVTNLWFDTEAEEAAEFYCSVFPNSRIVAKTVYPKNADRAGTALTVNFELDGERYTGINAGPQFKFTEAISLLVNCKDQDEIDYYWEKLSEGGEEGPCGWLKDRFGLSWQIAPEGADEVYAEDADPEAAQRAFDAMQKMGKLDAEELKRAAEGAAA